MRERRHATPRAAAVPTELTGAICMREHLDDAPYGTFAEGQADPGRYSDDDRAGSFGDGQAALPVDLDPGRFSAGMEELGDDDPEKRAIGSFGDEEPPS
jgi:hypothetical protein